MPSFSPGLVVSQLTRPGAPVCYGCFTSNVAMRSGAPAFGTPENVRAAFASGQLARLVGVPWRSSGSCTANCVDAQSVYETQMAMWGATLGGANFVAHAAGWMEGGLTGSMEKFIVDIEMLQQMAELMQPVTVEEGGSGVRGDARCRQRWPFLRHAAHDGSLRNRLLRTLPVRLE